MLFELLLPYGQWAFGESRVRKKSCSKNNSWLKIIRGSRFSEVFHYNSHLVGYEVFGVATIVGLAQVLHQGRTVGDPTHKVVGGCVGVVVGEVEHGEVLFAVAFDFHFCLWDFNGLSM